MTRDEEIGRAAWDEYLGHATADLGHPRRILAEAADMWANIALAAVSRAREIDTCETCKRFNDQYWFDNGDGPCLDIDVEFDPTKDGCNRHQPKEA